MELETRQCKAEGCENTWRCLKTSKTEYCCVKHSPDWEKLSSYSFSADKYRKIRNWLIDTMGEEETEYGGY